MVNNNNLILSSKFWTQYKTLSDDEAKDFADFVSAGIFARTPKAGRLAKVLRVLRQEPMTVAEVYSRTFEKSAFNEQVLRNYLSELNDALHEFLAMVAMHQRPVLQNWMYLESVRVAAYQPELEKQLEQDRYQPELKTTDDMFAYFRQLQIVDEYAATQAHKKRYDLLVPAMHMLTDHYITAMLRMYCEAVNRKALRSQNYDEEALQFFLTQVAYIEQSRPLTMMAQLFKSVLNIIMFPAEENYFEILKNLLQKHIIDLDKSMAREICLYAQNYCIRHINLNHSTYMQELLSLYDFMILHNVISEGPFMTQYTFKNYITLSLRLHQFDSALHFIKQQQHRLHESVREQAARYNLAAVYFEQGEHGAAMEELFYIQMQDPIYYLDSRAILLKIYFAQQDVEAVGSLYHAVKTYLLRNKQLPRKQAELYRNLFMLSNKLMMLSQNWKYLSPEDAMSRKLKLTSKIELSPVANKPWLMTQLNAL